MMWLEGIQLTSGPDRSRGQEVVAGRQMGLKLWAGREERRGEWVGPGKTQVILWGSATCYLLHQQAQRRPQQGAGSSCSGLRCHSRSSGEELVEGDVGVRRGMELACVHRQTQGGSGFRTRTH